MARLVTVDAFMNLVGVMPDAMLLLSAEGRIRGTNSAGAAFLGESPAELAGPHLSSFVTDSDAEVGAAVRLWLSAEEVVAHPLHVRDADGATRRFLGEGARIAGDSDGEPLILLRLREEALVSRGLGHDLQEANARLSQLLSMSPDPTIAVNHDGRIVFFSPSAETTFGYPAQEVMGQPLEMLIPERFAPAHHQHMERFANEGVPSRSMNARRGVSGLRKDGTEFPAQASISCAHVDGKPCYTVMIQDVSEHQAQAAALRQAQKMEAVGQLTGGIAHDFNNLLTVLIGNLEMLHEGSSLESRDRTFITQAMAAAARGAELTKQLLAFSRAQTLNPIAVKLGDIVEDMHAMLRSALGEAVEVMIIAADDLWTCEVDPAQVESTILNLTINARDAMPAGGKLTVEVSNVHVDDDYAAKNEFATAGPYVMLAISDDGTGMSSEVAERAFDPFFTTKGPGEGSGLGLSMVYGFVKQSGGHVKIYSETGHGTVVRVYLPRSGKTPDAEPSRAPADEPRGHGEVVLVVEDDRGVRSMIVRLLTELGYTVLDVGDGPSAIALLSERDDVDLLLTDLVLPGGMYGVDVARTAREIMPDLRILYTSGYSPNAISQQHHLNAGSELLQKPFTKSVIATIVARVLRESAT